MFLYQLAKGKLKSYNIHLVTQLKLRTYRMYKHDLCTEEYVKMNLTRTTRLFIAQFRIDICPCILKQDICWNKIRR